MINRVILIVLDSVGIGALPDADEYGDVGSNTLCNIYEKLNGINMPNMINLGIGNIDGINNLKKIENTKGCYGRLCEVSKGKDTTTGHWEIAGVTLKEKFPTYPNGFPKEIIEEFKAKTGLKDILGNCVASGTEIIRQYGEEHVKTKYPIIYTSADSVFQIAAHEDIISVEELYNICKIARSILVEQNAVGRVIARPFIGKDGQYTRTRNRRDFSLKPLGTTILDELKANNYDVIAVGKIEDIFAGEGITKAVHTSSNMDGVDKTLEFIKQDNKGLIFTNLVDFDMLYGHRNDVEGYRKAIEEFDKRLPEIFNAMKKEDILLITADHGCDPTTLSTDHSREYIPLLMYGDDLNKGINIGTRKTFCDIATTIADIFKINNNFNGQSFLEEVNGK